MILVTGGSGFIGTNFINMMLEGTQKVINIDKNIPGQRSKIVTPNRIDYLLDLRGKVAPRIASLIDEYNPDWIVHFAAESHVDTSIIAPIAFEENNVMGTINILEAMRIAKWKPMLLHVSTDEVYGSLGLGEDNAPFMEHDAFHPNSPYAASKAAAECFVRAYGTTYNIPYIITRSSNNYGPHQLTEKMIPKAITNVIQGKKVPLYGRGLNERDWIHVMDNCRGIRSVMNYGMVGEAYNIGGSNCIDNLSLLKIIITAMNEDHSKFIEFVADRPGHDLKYEVETHKLKQLGWSPQVNLYDGLVDTIQWYRDNEQFWKQ